jgi:hypothetical protein
MKKIIFLSCIFILAINISAQNEDEKKYILSTNKSSIIFSTLNFTDPYLSPLPYSGLGVSYNSDINSLLSPERTNISMQSKLNMATGRLLNPASTASMIYFGMNYGRGIQYYFQPVNGLQLWAGGLWDIDFGYKEIERNVNNPINFDLSTNLNLTGLASYDIHLQKRSLKIQLAVQSPLIGCMFVPNGGASYYEIFELGNMTNTIHFSSLHNKRGINGTFSMNVPFRYSTWRFGIGFKSLKYTANDLVFKRNELNLLIGTTFDFAKFSGMKNKAPKNFISTNE